jgi:Na+-driven multidrug efflux pump
MIPASCGQPMLPARTIVLVYVLVVVVTLSFCGIDGAGIAAVLSGLAVILTEFRQPDRGWEPAMTRWQRNGQLKQPLGVGFFAAYYRHPETLAACVGRRRR